MAQVSVNLKMDEEKKRIPFEVDVDSFYTESNTAYLEQIAAEIESGKAKLVEHQLVEDED